MSVIPVTADPPHEPDHRQNDPNDRSILEVGARRGGPVGQRCLSGNCLDGLPGPLPDCRHSRSKKEL